VQVAASALTQAAISGIRTILCLVRRHTTSTASSTAPAPSKSVVAGTSPRSSGLRRRTPHPGPTPESRDPIRVHRVTSLTWPLPEAPTYRADREASRPHASSYALPTLFPRRV
jgi:hypothetical protein